MERNPYQYLIYLWALLERGIALLAENYPEEWFAPFVARGQNIVRHVMGLEKKEVRYDDHS